MIRSAPVPPRGLAVAIMISMTMDPASMTSLVMKGVGRERTRKASEDVARRLVAFIVDNRLSDGARLPTEAELQRHFGVGRTTLREALRLLETQGALTIKAGPRGGPVVRLPRPEDLRGSLT